MEFVCVVFLLFRSYDAVPKIYFRQLIIYAAIYLPIIIFLTHDISNPITVLIAHIFIIASLMFFIRKNFNKKFSVQMFMNILTLYLALILLQMLFTLLLALLIPGEVERTFANGLIVMGLTMASCMYLYIYIDVINLPRKLKNTKNHLISYVAVSMFVMLLILVLFIFARSLLWDIHALVIYALLIVGATFITVVIFNIAIKYVLEKRAKTLALKKFIQFENQPSSQRIGTDEYDGHLEIAHSLALIGDSEKTAKYIKDCWNNFADDGGEGYAYMGDTTKLLSLDNQALAAYLYIKLKKLKSMGLKKAKVNVWSHITITKSKIKPVELMKALDYIIDEIIESIDRDKAIFRVNVGKESDERPFIEVSNKNDRLPEMYYIFVEKMDYSLKKGRDDGLFKLKRIIEDNDCELQVKSDEYFILKIIL